MLLWAWGPHLDICVAVWAVGLGMAKWQSSVLGVCVGSVDSSRGSVACVCWHGQDLFEN